MYPTMSIRERIAVQNLGELVVKVTAKQGFSACPITNEVVSVLASTFSSYVRDNLKKRKLLCSETGLDFKAIMVMLDTDAAMRKLPQIKSFTFTTDGDENKVVHVEFNQPITRTHGRPCQGDSQASFTLSWTDIRDQRRTS